MKPVPLTRAESDAVRRARAKAYEICGIELGQFEPRPSVATVPQGKALAALIDHCVLNPTATHADISSACTAADSHGFNAVSVNPRWVEEAVSKLSNSGTGVIAMVSFPLGQDTSQGKVEQTRRALRDGADGVDVVADLSALACGDYRRFCNDIRSVVEEAGPAPAIVIVEMGLAGDVYQQALGAALADLSGASVVKTSTGFLHPLSSSTPQPLGARPKDVSVVAAAVSAMTGVKAAGGIRTPATARALLQAGATRLGSSCGPLLMARPAGSGQ